MKQINISEIKKGSSEKQQKLLSVAVAVYNSEAYLENCLDSLIMQTYKNLEIILIDDGSTDKCGQICDDYAKKDSRIRVIHKKNEGLGASRNTGIENATGYYITFVDGDDWIDLKMYESMIEAIECANVDLAVCRYRCIYKNHIIDSSTDMTVIFEGKELLKCYMEEDEKYQIQNAAWNKLYKREIIQDVRFPEDRWYEDILYTTKLFAQIEKSIYIDKAFYNYRCDREGSMMNTGINPRIFTDQIPSYYEKSEFLYKIGEVEIAAIHDYYLYKRLLILYMQIAKSKQKNKKNYLEELKAKIYAVKNKSKYMFEWEGSKSSDKKKLDIFLISPTLYYYVMLINETFIIPIKERRI